REGGDLGWFVPDRSGFDARFVAALRRLRPGQVSEPVLTDFGYHVIRLDAARGDSVRASHILVPIDLRPARLDVVEARADSLDRLASEQTDPAALDSAAQTMRLPLARVRVTEGERVMLGRFVIPDAGVWAFEARPGETSPVIEGRVAYYVFRLDSLIPAGTPPLPQVREAVVEAVRREKKKAVIAKRAEQLAPALQQGPNLRAAAAGVGLVAQPLGPFTRLSPPPALGNEPLVLGAAFGLRVGQRSGVIAGEYGHYVVALEGRTPADSSAWLAQRDVEREALVQRARDARVQAYVAGLREQAKIVDRRQELARAPTDASVGAPIF
ncbi:MAG: peptidylprolyl isomerase, partial [Gemmatimonadales bacterium]